MAYFDIVYWNCHSINRNSPEYLWGISNLKYPPNIICLQETWCKTEQEHPNIEGYVLADFSVRFKSTGGGTAIYTRDNIPFLKNNIQSKQFETSSIKFNLDNSIITVVNLYNAQHNTKLGRTVLNT